MKTVYHVKGIVSVLSGLIFFLYFAGITIVPVLDNIETHDLIYSEGSGRLRITNTLTVNDPDSKSIRSALVQISEGYTSGEDVLVFSKQNRISGNWNKLTGTLTLTGSSSLANYQTALRSIQYENTNSTNPSGIKRTVSFRVNDGLGNSNTVTRNIAIITSNKAPLLSNIEFLPIEYCMNSGNVPVTSTITVSDPDNSNLTSARIQITNFNSADELIFVSQNGITGSWNSVTGVLSLTGTASVASYQAALRSISYKNSGSLAIIDNHSVSITANDGNSYGNTVTRNIEVNGRISAILSGTATVCKDDNTTVSLRVLFSGRSPWTLTLLRDNDNGITYNNITQNPFTINVTAEGIYRIKSLSDAHCVGDTTGSGYARIIFNEAPTAVISGVDTLCAGDTAEIKIDLTGKAPWNITVQNGLKRIVIDDIRQSPYFLKVKDAGNYTISEVQDALCIGKGSGTASVIQHPQPTAIISGNASICENTSTDISIALTGSAPWEFSYRHDSESPVTVTNVMQSPKKIAVNLAGSYTLTSMADKFCSGKVSGSAAITLKPSPEVTLSGLSSIYNKEDGQLVLISGSPSGGTFSGPALFFSDPNWYFLPRYAPLGTFNIVYSYQESPDGCYGYDTAVVRVLEADAIIELPDDRIDYCRNEPAFTIKGINMANGIGSFSISDGIGLIDNKDNTATITPSLLQVKEYTITYSYFDGMTLSVTKKIEIRTSPVADFHWETECFQLGQSIQFHNTSTTSFGNIISYHWKIQTPEGFDTDSNKNIVYTFPHDGNHVIELEIRTSTGCIGSTSKIFGLKPIFPLADEPYKEGFEDSRLHWQSGTSSLTTMNNWTLGNPEKGFSGASSGTNCWYTQIPVSASPHEQSWVVSPCFDFTGTERPMLKMDIWRLFDSNRDGANLQYTADSGKTWTLLGEIGDGINWFNNSNILGNPGGYPAGWSSNSSGAGNDGGWVPSAHSLGMLKGKKSVQLRISYGSDGTAHNNNGIAFDNIWIGNQNRIALIEHFTNSSSADSKDADLELNNLVNADTLNIIDLQYHTSFPGADPFNEQEPYIPGARALYYGLPDVPYSILNGGTKPENRVNYESSALDGKTVSIEALYNTKFEITIGSNRADNTITILTGVKAQEDLPAREYTVHVALIERKITGLTGRNGETIFESVVKTLLPDAAGTTMYKPWSSGEQQYVLDSWTIQNVYNEQELRIVSFIQDEFTGEIYQAAISPVGIGTSSRETEGDATGKFMIFPNPASDRVFVRFSTPVNDNIKIELFNNLGNLVYSGIMSAGESETEIPTGLYPDGIYLVRAMMAGQIMGIRKLTLIR